MKNARAFLSTYTADVSGVCSALFELGGMIVIYDGGGCNSTYTTHDEPRWYESDSMVFICKLEEMNAIMGDDETLICEIVDAARDLKPAFIAVAGTPVPMMIGWDYPSIALDIEKRTGIPAFGFNTNGTKSYVYGVGLALAKYAERFCTPGVTKSDRLLNILGATPLDFSFNAARGASLMVESMKTFCLDNDWRVQSVWAMGSEPEELAEAGKAQVNLVVSSVGIPLARILREKFATPYVVGTPAGAKFNQLLSAALRESATDCKNRTVFADYCAPADAPVAIIGESVTARSLACALHLEYGKEARVISALETEDGILCAGDRVAESEEEVIDALHCVHAVIADPLYKRILPAGCAFYSLPHEAFSGRIYHSGMRDLVRQIHFEE
jgi:nitrogenase molybdenum-iron protein alpha/beta subunit